MENGIERLIVKWGRGIKDIIKHPKCPSVKGLKYKVTYIIKQIQFLLIQKLTKTLSCFLASSKMKMENDKTNNI